MDDYALALAHYRLTFPTLASLGNSASTWRTEYDRVSSIGLSSTTVIGSSSEGATASAIRNFSQRVLMTALHAVRAELDSTYMVLINAAPPTFGQRHGSRIALTL